MSAITKEAGRECLLIRQWLAKGVYYYEGGRRLAVGACNHVEGWHTVSKTMKKAGGECLPPRRRLTEGVCHHKGGWQRVSATTKEAGRVCRHHKRGWQRVSPPQRRLAEGVFHQEGGWQSVPAITTKAGKRCLPLRRRKEASRGCLPP